MQTTGFKQLLFIPIIGSLLTDKIHSILAIIASKEGPVVEFAKVVATNASRNIIAGIIDKSCTTQL